MADLTTLFIKVDSSGTVTASKNLNALTVSATGTAKATDKATASTAKFNTVSATSTSVLAKAASGFKTVGRDISRYGLLIAGAGAASVKFAFDLSKGLGQVETLIPKTGDRIYELEDAVQSMSIESGKGFNELTEGLYQTISAFQDSSDAVSIFESATKAAVAGGASVADSIELASAVTKAYGDTSAEATEKVFDLAFEAVRLGQTTFPQLANGIQTATDSAVRLGVSQEELFAVFASLTGVIGDASEVATKFRSASASLLNPNKQLLALFSALGEELDTEITNGQQFVEAAGGIQSALSLIVDTAQKADEPLQDYIRRIEGITLSSRLAGNSAEKYASDLLAMDDATGRMDDSFKEVKEGIDAYRQSMLEARQQIIVAASEIGNTIIPALASFLQSIADTVTWISELDDDTQKMIVKLGAFVIALGPALIALGSLLRAFQLIVAIGPAVAGAVSVITGSFLGPVGLIASLATIAIGLGVMNSRFDDSIEALQEQRKAYDKAISEQSDFEKSLEETAKQQYNLNEEGLLSEQIISELIKKYPDLVDEVGTYAVALAAAKVEMSNLRNLENVEKAPDLFGIEIAQVQKLQEEVKKAAKEIAYAPETLAGAGQGIENFLLAGYTPEDARIAAEEVANEFKSGYISKMVDLEAEQEAIISAINEKAQELGIFAELPEGSGDVLFSAMETDIEDFLKETREKLAFALSAPGEGGDGDDTIKTWQQWFEELAGVAKEKFGNSGKVAGELFDESLLKAFGDERVYSEAFGEAFDPTSVIEEQLSSVKELYRDLLAIPEDEIDEFFEKLGIQGKSTNQVIEELEATIFRLTGAFKGFSEADVFSGLSDGIAQLEQMRRLLPEISSEEDMLTEKLKLQRDAFTQLAQAQGTSSATLQILQRDILATESALTDLIWASQDLSTKMARSFVYAITRMSSVASILRTDQDALIESLAILADSFLNIGIETVTQSFYEWGRAVGDATKDMSDFGDAMVDVLKSILDTLPAMFIQAGLQAIIAGNWGLGLTLVALGLSSSFLSGYTSGKIEGAESEADETNATGAVYSFAKGGASLGSFENSIVNSPTRFNNGAGLMGEAGAEAIMPLSRMSNGDLGVATGGSGGDAKVTVNITNTTGENVETTETTNSDGSKEIEVLIGSVMNKMIRSGKTDGALSERYGSKVRGY